MIYNTIGIVDVTRLNFTIFLNFYLQHEDLCEHHWQIREQLYGDTWQNGINEELKLDMLEAIEQLRMKLK